jgi:hypothetical protein
MRTRCGLRNLWLGLLAVLLLAASGVAVLAGPTDTGLTALKQGPRYYEAVASNGPVEWTYGGSTVYKLTPTATGVTASTGVLDTQITASSGTAVTDFLSLTNLKNGTSMTGTGIGVLFNQWYYDGTTPAVADAGRISLFTEGNWTSTGSTQDASMAFGTALNGTITNQLVLTSAGAVTATGVLTGDDVASVDDLTAGDALTVTGATALNGTVGIGNAVADVATVTGTLLLRQVNDADMSGVPGTEGEIVYNLNNDTAYVCTVTSESSATWVIAQGAGSFTTLATSGNVTLGDAATDTVGVTGDLTVSDTTALNGAATGLGDASTDVTTCIGRFIPRTLGADPLDVTPGSRPAGSAGEIALYTDVLYLCTNASTPTWVAVGP